MVVSTNTAVCVILGVDSLGGVAQTRVGCRIYYTTTAVVIDHVASVLACLMHLMVLPKRVDKECLHHLLRACHNGIDGIEQVGIVHHYLGGLLWEFIARIVDHIYQSGIGEILDVIHHRGSAGRDVVCQIAYVWSLGTV